MIELTVALPLYNSKHIGWLAIESLVRQVGVDFEWELIVAEEQNDMMFGEKRVMEYASKLDAVNCKRIYYIPLKQWISLGQKWRLIGQNASKESIGFILQAGDCYSNKNRLKMTRDAFVGGADWVQMPNHLYYDILTHNMYIADRKKWFAMGASHPCGADMAGRMNLIKRLPDIAKPRSVDMWLYKCCEKIKGGTLNVYWDLSDNWKYSINAHGLNNISDRENWWNRPYMVPVKWIDNIPSDIYKKLVECRQIAKTWHRAIGVRTPSRIKTKVNNKPIVKARFQLKKFK